MPFLMSVGIAAENGILDNLQVLVLMIATLVFWRRCYALYQKSDLDLLAYGLFISNISFVGSGRELSFGAELGLGEQGVLIVQLIMSLFWGLFVASSFVVFWRSVDRKFAEILRYLMHPTSLHVYLAIVVFGVSSAFEQGALLLPKSMVLEEVVELLSFVILVRAAWVLK